MPPATVTAINLDCADPARLASFWAHLLDGEIMVRTPGFWAVRIGGLHLGAVRVDSYEPPTWPSRERPQQIHLDLVVEDLDTGEREAVRLGATTAAQQPDPARSRVLCDPAGHPFCLRT